MVQSNLRRNIYIVPFDLHFFSGRFLFVGPPYGHRVGDTMLCSIYMKGKLLNSFGFADSIITYHDLPLRYRLV